MDYAYFAYAARALNSTRWNDGPTASDSGESGFPDAPGHWRPDAGPGPSTYPPVIPPLLNIEGVEHIAYAPGVLETPEPRQNVIGTVAQHGPGELDKLRTDFRI